MKKHETNSAQTHLGIPSPDSSRALYAARSRHRTQSSNPLFVDLFAGCGGLSLGLEQAGFSPCFMNELVPGFAETYAKNRGFSSDRCFIGDIHDLLRQYSDFLPKFKNAEMVCGGPPCQGFSMANRQRLIDDPRNHLYKAYLEFLAKFRPRFFIMENVRGMMSRIEEIVGNFSHHLGNEYNFSFRILNAADFGVPQNRQRLILIGNRIGVSSDAVFQSIRSKSYPTFVLRDALEGLPPLGNKAGKNLGDVEDSTSGFFSRVFDYPKTPFYSFINNGRRIDRLFNHKNRYNNDRDVEIFRRLPQGGNSLHPSIADIMPYSRRNGIFKDKYFKLDETQVCKTITSHMKFDCNMYIHPWEPRGLSPREAARIQTFPDDFVFYGAQNNWFAQIGNAVPPKLAFAIGLEIRRFL